MLQRDSLRKWCAALLALVASAVVMPALADDELPGRVGRVADVAGELFLAPQDTPDQWNAIGINYPVTTGDNLWVGNDGRTEIDFGGGQFRLSGATSLQVSRLDDRNFALFVAQGTVILRVRVLDPGESARIDTPNAQVVLMRPGLYRIEVAADRPYTQVAVREGAASVDIGASVQEVFPGQNAILEGAMPAYAQLRNGAITDGFDTWSATRDRHYERGRANSPVSRQMVGYSDLDDYGAWESAPEYGGAVWYPANVAPDWAPYRNGYWTEVGAWGPTWVDAAPWGYAPFHYGRWAHIRGRWGWCPGGYVARPVWAPALVGWVGGSGWRVGVGGPVYGWVPLGWGESYQPHWRGCSDGCWTRFNKPYAVNVSVRIHTPPVRYANATAPGAVSAVSGPTFAGRKPVQTNLVSVNSAVLATAPILAAPPVRQDSRPVPVVRPGSGVPPPASILYAATPRTPRAVSPTGTSTPQGRSAVPTPAPLTATRAPLSPVSPGPVVVQPMPVGSAPTVGSTPTVSTHPGSAQRPPQGVPVVPSGQIAVPVQAEVRPRMQPIPQPVVVAPNVSPHAAVPQGVVQPQMPIVRGTRSERVIVPATMPPAPPAVSPAPHPNVVAPVPRPQAVVPGAPPAGHPVEAPKVEKPAAPRVAVPGDAPPRQ
ncbi:MAG: DUF6600 domain-containing protein [Betaproteobacteria bacterium]